MLAEVFINNYCAPVYFISIVICYVFSIVLYKFGNDDIGNKTIGGWEESFGPFYLFWIPIFGSLMAALFTYC